MERELFEREKEQGDFKRRSKQAILHLTLTEMRIAQLEAELRKLQADFHNRPDDFVVGVSKRQCTVYKSILKPLMYGNFRSTSRSHWAERPSMEILVTEHGTTLGTEDDNPSSRTLKGPHQRTPERLRIRYVPLIKTIERICSEALSSDLVWGVTGRPETAAPSVILRPWKLFVAYEKEIRNSVQEVEAQVEAARQKEAKGRQVDKGVMDEREW